MHWGYIITAGIIGMCSGLFIVSLGETINHRNPSVRFGYWLGRRLSPRPIDKPKFTAEEIAQWIIDFTTKSVYAMLTGFIGGLFGLWLQNLPPWLPWIPS